MDPFRSVVQFIGSVRLKSSRSRNFQIFSLCTQTNPSGPGDAELPTYDAQLFPIDLIFEESRIGCPAQEARSRLESEGLVVKSLKIFESSDSCC